MKCSRIAVLGITVAAMFSSEPLNAEIEQLANPCDAGRLCVDWWPRLPPMEGWHHDTEVSRDQHANFMVPDGSTFAAAESFIYARALYKEEMKNTASVDALIAHDKRGYLEHLPDG